MIDLKNYDKTGSITSNLEDEKLNEFEMSYIKKIENLENLTQNLRKIIKEFELRLEEKQTDRLKDKQTNQTNNLMIHFSQMVATDTTEVSWKPKKWSPLLPRWHG